MIGEAVHYILSNSSLVTDIVDDRIFPLVIPLEENIPAIIYLVQNAEPIDNKVTRNVLHDNTVIELVLISRDYSEVQDLASAVRKTLFHQHYIYNDIRVKDVRFQSGQDLYESTTDTYLHRMTFRFSSIIKSEEQGGGTSGTSGD